MLGGALRQLARAAEGQRPGLDAASERSGSRSSPRAAERRPTAFAPPRAAYFKVERKLREEYDKQMAALCRGARRMGGAGQEGPRPEARAAGRGPAGHRRLHARGAVRPAAGRAARCCCARTSWPPCSAPTSATRRPAHQCRAGRTCWRSMTAARGASIACIRGKMFVENWSAVPVGHIQPAKVRQLVTGLSDDGLLQRFMIVMPPRVDAGRPGRRRYHDRLVARSIASRRSSRSCSRMQPPETQGHGGKPEYLRGRG